MAQVSILRRDQRLRSPVPGQSEVVVAVSYATELFLPRTVDLPLASYREATPDELAANPNLTMIPIAQSAQDAELLAIRQDYDRACVAKPLSFELP
jgi:hypothetical protein